MGLRKCTGNVRSSFYTNGYDIWMWDDALNYPPAKGLWILFQGQSPVSRKFPERRQEAAEFAWKSMKLIVNRLYQIEAIKRVC